MPMNNMPRQALGLILRRKFQSVNPASRSQGFLCADLRRSLDSGFAWLRAQPRKPNHASCDRLQLGTAQAPRPLARFIRALAPADGGGLVHTGNFAGDDFETYLAAARQSRETNNTVLDKLPSKVVCVMQADKFFDS